MARYSRAFRLYQVAAWHQFIILTSIATYLLLAPLPEGAFQSTNDKVLHIIGWMGLTLSLRLAWPTLRFHYWAVVGVFLYSILLEALQGLVPQRHFSYLDLVANGVGVMLGYVIARLTWPWVDDLVIRRLR